VDSKIDVRCVRLVSETVCRFTGPVYIVYKIEAEKFTGTKVSRIQFKEASSIEDGFFLELRLTLFASNELCQQHTAYINV